MDAVRIAELERWANKRLTPDALWRFGELIAALRESQREVRDLTLRLELKQEEKSKDESSTGRRPY